MSKDKGDHWPMFDGSVNSETEQCRADIDQFLNRLMVSEEKLKKWRQLVMLMRRISRSEEPLSFEQICMFAQHYAETYERFLASKVPINALEVRVGEMKFWNTILNHPDGMKETTFERYLPQDSVLQVWRSADMEFDEVPLLFQALEDIPSEGLSTTENYQNGRSITLDVKKQQNGEFKIKLSFAVGEGLVKPAQLLNRDETLDADTGRVSRPMFEWAYADNDNLWPKVFTFAANYGSTFMALAVLVCFLLNPLNGYFCAPKAQENTGAQAAQAVVKQPVALPADSSPPGDPWSLIIQAQKKTEPAQRAGQSKKLPTQSAAPSTTIPAQPAIPRAKPPLLAPSDKSYRAADLYEAMSVVIPNNLVQQKLAKMTQVFVEEPNDAMLDAHAKLSVRAKVSMREKVTAALKKYGITPLTKEEDKSRANGIIELQVGPNEIKNGKVYVILYDKNNQFILVAPTECKVQSTERLCEASQRLGEFVVQAIQEAKSSIDKQEPAPSNDAVKPAH
jgi:hypothetical protein